VVEAVVRGRSEREKEVAGVDGEDAAIAMGVAC
jgi:hypothetical protein